ncbi:MAG: Hpt domain-containing protein [Bdellovibrionota bacterium]
MMQPELKRAFELGIIDEKRLIELYELDDGSKSFALSLVEDFMLQRETYFLSFELCLNNGDVAALGREAHKLKSSLANIAASRAARCCANIEEKVKVGAPIQTLKLLVEDLKLEVSDFTVACQQL